MMDRALTSKKVMPRNSGVSNVRATASRSNSVSASPAAGWREAGPSVRKSSQRMDKTLEPQHDEAAERTPSRLVVRTVPVPDPGDLIARLPEPGALAWVRRGDGLVAWGTAAKIILPAGGDRFVTGEKWLRELFDGADVADEVAVPGSGPVAFGSFTFDPTSDGSVLVIPRTVLGRADGAAWLTTI